MIDLPWEIRLVRSPNRKRTADARVHGDVLEVRVPEGMAPERERQLVDRLTARLQARHTRAGLNRDEALMKRAEELNRRYFKGTLKVNSVRFVTNQQSRFGSCTPSTATIRLSDRLAGMPDWVRDYVLIHELAHLVEPNHSPDFWKLVHRYTLAERAIGFLMGSGMNEEGDGEELGSGK